MTLEVLNPIVPDAHNLTIVSAKIKIKHSTLLNLANLAIEIITWLFLPSINQLKESIIIIIIIMIMIDMLV